MTVNFNLELTFILTFMYTTIFLHEIIKHENWIFNIIKIEEARKWIIHICWQNTEKELKS